MSEKKRESEKVSARECFKNSVANKGTLLIHKHTLGEEEEQSEEGEKMRDKRSRHKVGVTYNHFSEISFQCCGVSRKLFYL